LTVNQRQPSQRGIERDFTFFGMLIVGQSDCEAPVFFPQAIQLVSRLLKKAPRQ